MFPTFFETLSFDPRSYRFHRPMLEREGYYVIEKDGKILVLLNVLGVAKEDISVDVKTTSENKELIVVNGTTKNEDFDKEFSINMSFLVGKPMETLEWDMSNGFMTMALTFKEPVKPSVKIISK
jgi:HSP20 family molecular chaperone IbpA